MSDYMREDLAQDTEFARRRWEARLGETESFDRWLAEVERAAAEKAWDEGANAVTCEWRLHPERGDAVVKHAQVRTRRPANPYGKGAWQ